MRQIAWKFTLLGGLLLVTGVACTDQTPPRASNTTQTTPIEATPVPVEEPLTYVVVQGDFLSEIAKQFEVELEDLIELNGIENAALIEVGQELIIPGATTVAVDHFFAAEPSQRWPEIYPPDELPPPVEPTPLQELRNRIAAWPWPPRETMVSGGVIAGFAVAALLVGLILGPVEYRSRRWAARATPRAGRRAFHWWGNAAVVPRHAYIAIRRRVLTAWRFSVVAAHAAWRGIKAADQRYRRARAAVIVGWVRTKVHRERLADRAKPVLERADDIAGRAVDVTLERTRDLVDTVRDRTPTASDGFNVIGERATSVRRTVATGAQRAKRDAFEPAQPERWRTRIASELANAFERGQLQVRYVPLIDLDAHAVSAVEAHLFWQHPQRGLMAARDIHTATQDHPELGAALLEFLLEQSCGFVKDRVDRRFPSAQLIVPITLEQIVESEPLAAIDRGLTSANLALDRLKVSIAERHALRDPLTATAFIRNLRSMGIGVHLDDYGMAAAGDLQQLGVSSVTVDFAAAGTSAEAREILSDAVEAAQELRLPITARHARTEAARNLQASLGCSFEAVGEPLPADAFVKAHVDETPALPAAEPGPSGAPALPAGSPTAGSESPIQFPSTDASSEVNAPAAESSDAVGSDSAVETDESRDTVEKQTHRPSGPLRVSRPSPATADDSAVSDGPAAEVAATDAEDDADLEDHEDGATDESAPTTDAPGGGRPVDAA